ncbi:MAG TPA: hypothetical protein PLT46_08480 [Burkholderiaceae bacterium]|nr:hypothetical protein [Burkholderiaceae bacterium]HPL78822.1 hypothetical protein [Burkholderiaceae bacterium]
MHYQARIGHERQFTVNTPVEVHLPDACRRRIFVLFDAAQN